MRQQYTPDRGGGGGVLMVLVLVLIMVGATGAGRTRGGGGAARWWAGVMSLISPAAINAAPARRVGSRAGRQNPRFVWRIP